MENVVEEFRESQRTLLLNDCTKNLPKVIPAFAIGVGRCLCPATETRRRRVNL